jgi:two-component system response regulator HydG
LNVFAIAVPALRERPEDVLPLAERILERRGLPAEKLGTEARKKLVAHAWPGNVRELENSLERALILAGPDEIGPGLLTLGQPLARGEASRAAALLTEGFNLDAFEHELLRAALERTGGNKSAAARLLGITRRRLYSRLESLGQSSDAEDTTP